MLLFIVIHYINLFVFDDEIEMKNRSTIDINICTNKSGPFIHETEHARYMQSSSFASQKLAPCKKFFLAGSYFLRARAAPLLLNISMTFLVKL
jgi:hypothetical protein